MSKHRHYEMIVAKAANMDLVLFVKTCDNGAWYEKENKALQWWEDSNYFLCLPQHKEACLHWLNGGEVCDDDNYVWSSSKNAEWTLAHFLMCEDLKLKPKPKKVKRWIGVYGKDTTKLFYSKESLKNYVDNNYYYKDCDPENWQFIEIEVEE